MTVIAMINARMKSERFPGKVIAPLYGKPMIHWIIETAKRTRGIDTVVLATSADQSNDVLEKEARLAGADIVIRGPETDLLRRHEMVYEATGFDWAADLSGDSPVYTPEVIERFIAAIPEADRLGAFGIGPFTPYNAHYGNPVGNLHSVRRYRAYFDMREKILANYDESRLEQYWICAQDLGFVDEAPFVVDCCDVLPPEKTPVKISVDYSLELAVLDKVCRWLGHFPKSLTEVYRAYREIKEL